jgi:FolB domain-containing protein
MHRAGSYAQGMDAIIIEDLGVLCRIGVPEEERSKPQRLLLSIRLEGDFSNACRSDEIAATIDYFELSRRLIAFCQSHTFKLIEKLAYELTQLILQEFRPQSVTVQVKKYVLSEARYVAFELKRPN